MSTFRLRDWQLFMLVHGLFVGTVMAPLLLRQSLMSEIYFTYPLFNLYTPKAILTGEAWMNRLNLNGFPTFISVDFYSMNPLVWLFTGLLPPFDNLHWFIFTTFVLGGVLCAMLLRKMGYSRSASIIGSSSYITASWVLTVTSQFVAVLPVLPLVGFVLMDSRVRFGRATLSSILLVAYVLYVVFAQIALMVFMAFGAGALIMSFHKDSTPSQVSYVDRSLFFRRVLPITVFILLFLLVITQLAVWLTVLAGGAGEWQDYLVGLGIMAVTPLLVTLALIANVALMFRDPNTFTS